MTDTITRRHALALAAALPLGACGALAQEEGPREVLEMARGAEDAPVTLIEYASFTCPHCATFHSDVYPSLRADYIDTGKLRFVLREVYFDRYGLWAGMIARCAGPTRYFGLVDIIFERQRDWTAGGDPATIIGNLYAIGRQAGMTNAEMEACVMDEGFAKALVAEYQKNAEADDVQGTPTLLVNGSKVENTGYQALKAVIDSELEG